MLKAKAGRAMSWLPSQVAYGVDCSDDDPKNWKPFGQLVDDAAAAEEAKKAQPASKSGQPTQSTPAPG